jgi:SAM-dependent methyltransferase
MRERLVRAMASGGAVPVLWMIAVGSYLPLHSLPGADALLERAWSASVGALLTQQVREPLDERLARKFIPHLTAIADDVSLQVKQQYEDHPAPRWVKPAPAGEPKTMPQYFGGWYRPRPELGRHDRIDILVAGCGTGQNLVETARDFKGALVLAVDLSLASLCYAKRQALALGLTNIAFGEADILKLGGIGRTFDIVDASGVLHHMADPWAGWQVLLSLLRPADSCGSGCTANSAARTSTPPAPHRPAWIRCDRPGYQAQPPGYFAVAGSRTRARRSPGISTSSPSANAATCCSMCRSIRCRCPRSRISSARTRSNFSASSPIPTSSTVSGRDFRSLMRGGDLGLWQDFETDNPGVFAGMYQFWVRKNG